MNPPEKKTIQRIRARGISKKFNIQSGPRAFVRVFVPGKKPPMKIIQALSNVDIIIGNGEVVGMIGKNGSGKSTLLRIIGGLYRKDSGTIETEGTSLYIGGFSPSSNPYLTVRQNILLTGSIMGVRQKDMRKAIDNIVAFAGLEEFIDVEAMKLSSGMITRLHMSTTLHCMNRINPQILLLDEILSVGSDLEFQERSMKRISELIRGGAAVLMVSHSLSLIKRYCDRVVWLEHGRIAMEGNSLEVIEKYREKYGH